jgi:hypothetical protein
MVIIPSIMCSAPARRALFRLGTDVPGKCGEQLVDELFNLEPLFGEEPLCVENHVRTLWVSDRESAA